MGQSDFQHIGGLAGQPGEASACARILVAFRGCLSHRVSWRSAWPSGRRAPPNWSPTRRTPRSRPWRRSSRQLGLSCRAGTEARAQGGEGQASAHLRGRIATGWLRLTSTGRQSRPIDLDRLRAPRAMPRDRGMCRQSRCAQRLRMDSRGTTPFLANPRGAWEALVAEVGIEVPHIVSARDHTRERMGEICEHLGSEALAPKLSICVFGSWAREELTPESDDDWAGLPQGHTEADGGLVPRRT